MLLVGLGNLGQHLATALHQNGVPFGQILARNENKADIALALNAQLVTRFADLDARPGLCVLCVPDGAIAAVAEQLQGFLHPETAVVHTSGGTPSTVLAPYFVRHGVFYPLQTFSPGQKIDWPEVPILVYSPEEKLRLELLRLALRLSPLARVADDAQREALHVAAVFVNNFSNHLFRIGAEICTEKGLDFALLRPLIQATVDKLALLDPAAAQTGPARRGDTETMARHLRFLAGHPDWATFYRLFSEAIAKG